MICLGGQNLFEQSGKPGSFEAVDVVRPAVLLRLPRHKQAQCLRIGRIADQTELAGLTAEFARLPAPSSRHIVPTPGRGASRGPLEALGEIDNRGRNGGRVDCLEGRLISDQVVEPPGRETTFP